VGFKRSEAADSCGDWRKVSNGWITLCVDHRGRNICYVCRDRRVSNDACTKIVGAIECSKVR
jgi:hypothetical protein